MCGICGIVDLTGARGPVPAEIAAMAALFAHRGPDAHGVWCEGATGLGHQRLSVIDLAGGTQPMASADDRHVIVFNGEIYNYRDLRARLPEVAFRTNSDTETLLFLAARGAPGWLDSLIGMFAFAVWDRHERKLLLVRDRLGIKPLYYRLAGGRFHFASEIKALVRADGVSAGVNAAAVPEYVAFRNVAGAETLFEGVRELPPGHFLTLDADTGRTELTCWWRDDVLAVDPPGLGLPAGMPLVEALTNSIRYRLVADVPIGTYNSGGVDSSLVTHYVRGMTEGVLHTFSVGFHEATFDESRWAQIVADQVGSEHHKLLIDAGTYADNLPLAIWHNDEPLHHAHTVQLLLLSAEAKRYVTVVLTGEGADELFAGYPRYQIPLLATNLSRLPAPLWRGLHAGFRAAGQRRLAKLAEVAGDVEASVVEQARFAPRRTLERLGLPGGGDARYATWRALAAAGGPLLEQVLAYDRRTYLPSLLQRLDRTTMAHGLEARVPFLDHRLVAWSRALDRSRKLVPGRDNKVILKQLAREVFPAAMVDRRKMGFDVPVGVWLRQPAGLGRYLDVLTDRTFLQRGHVDGPGVVRLVDEHRSGREDHADVLWPLLNLELWFRMFIDDFQKPA